MKKTLNFFLNMFFVFSLIVVLILAVRGYFAADREYSNDDIYVGISKQNIQEIEYISQILEEGFEESTSWKVLEIDDYAKRHNQTIPNRIVITGNVLRDKVEFNYIGSIDARVQYYCNGRIYVWNVVYVDRAKDFYEILNDLADEFNGSCEFKNTFYNYKGLDACFNNRMDYFL